MDKVFKEKKRSFMYDGIFQIKMKAALSLKVLVKRQVDLNHQIYLRQENGLKNYDLLSKKCCNLESIVLQ